MASDIEIEQEQPENHDTDNEVVDETKGWHTITGELCEFQIRPDLPLRRWFTVNIKFGLARRILKVEPYDPAKGRGEQRNTVGSHVNKLVRAMAAGHFTPASWSGGVREGHLKNLEIDPKKKRVKLRINERNPIPCLDGGHRNVSLEKIRETSDKKQQEAVDNLTITVQIYLDPKWIREDFRNLQAGRNVSKSQLKFMQEEESAALTVSPDDKKTPVKNIARKTAWVMNKLSNKESFLSGDINFTGEGGGKVQYASITAEGGSDLATSIYGGAKICLHEGFRQYLSDDKTAMDFLVECYTSVWQGIYKYDSQIDYQDPVDGSVEKFPELLLPGKMLRPNSLKAGSTKSGTSLLVMLGNVLAFRMLTIRKDIKIPSTEVKRLVEAAREILNDDVRGGGSGSAKRELTGEFVRYYLQDVIRKRGSEHDNRKLGAIDGVPSLLCDVIWTRSTLAVSKKATEFSDFSIDEEDETLPSRLSDPDQTDEEWTETTEYEGDDLLPPEMEIDTGEVEEEPSGKGRKKKGAMG